MATQAKRSNQVLEAMIWYYGKRHCRSVTFQDDVASSLEDQYFTLNTINDDYEEELFYVWYNGGAGTDPNPGNGTGIEVTFTPNDTKETLVTLTIAALASNDVILSDLGEGVLQIENDMLGPITAEFNSAMPELTGSILQEGSGGELGAVAAGGATLTTEQSLETITRDDEGEIAQDLISKGATYSIEMTLAEMTAKNWENLIGNIYGDKHTVGSDDLVGYGISKLYKSAFDFSGQLVGHPKRLANSDRSADICMWLTPANMTDINYTGQEAQGASFSFTGLPDRAKPDAINIFARGDHSLV